MGGLGYLAKREGGHRAACGECGYRKRIGNSGRNSLRS